MRVYLSATRAMGAVGENRTRTEESTRLSTWRVYQFRHDRIGTGPGNRTLLLLFVGQRASPETEPGVVAADGVEPSRPSLWGSSAPGARSVGTRGGTRTHDDSFRKRARSPLRHEGNGALGENRTRNSSFGGSNDLRFTTRALASSGGFEPPTRGS